MDEAPAHRTADDPPGRSPGRVAHLRAGLIAVVLLVHGVVALPIGPKITEASIASERGQRQFLAWHALVAPLGVDTDTFARWLIDGSSVLVDVDRALTSPVRPLFRLTGTGQAWALFASEDRDPHRLVVRVRHGEGTPWETVFRQLDPAHGHPWIGSHVGFRRHRGLWDGQGKYASKPYRLFGRSLSEAIFAEDPSVSHVELHLERSCVAAPGERPCEEVEVEIVHRRRYTPRAP